MLRECIFHQPVIPCDTFRRLISCLASTDVTQLYLHSVLSFNRSGKIRYFPKKSDLFNFGWLFTALQVGVCTKDLEKMNGKFI